MPDSMMHVRATRRGALLRAFGALIAVTLAVTGCRPSTRQTAALDPLAPANASVVTLRVMTYNIAAGGGDLARIERTIRESGAEVVALQEVDVAWSPRSNFADQPALLAKALGMEVRFAPIYIVETAGHTPSAQFGVALLSRFPIVRFRNHDITRLSTQTPGVPASPAPGFLEAIIDVRGTRLRVFNTHLDYRANPAVRVRQVAEMLAVVGDSAAPTLLLGDLNATPDAAELQPLFRRLQDVWPVSAGVGFSYPAQKPAKRIDYVLASPGIRATSVRTIESDASDHRPVVADLVLIGRPAPR